MSPLARWLAPLPLTATLLFCCSSPQVGSNSNWLTACTKSEDCTGSNQCLCGVCSLPCSTGNDCSDLQDGECSSIAPASTNATGAVQCGSRPPAGVASLCLPSCEAGACAGEGRCVDGRCVLAPVPASTFCAELPAQSAEERRLEDEVLTLLERALMDGSLQCASGETATASRALRLDGRLACEARAAALGMNNSDGDSTVDPWGKDTTERLALTGYSPMDWVNNSCSVTSASEAFDSMIASTLLCPALVDNAFSDIGIGVRGSYVTVIVAYE